MGYTQQGDTFPWEACGILLIRLRDNLVLEGNREAWLRKIIYKNLRQGPVHRVLAPSEVPATEWTHGTSDILVNKTVRVCLHGANMLLLQLSNPSFLRRAPWFSFVEPPFLSFSHQVLRIGMIPLPSLGGGRVTQAWPQEYHIPCAKETGSEMGM